MAIEMKRRVLRITRLQHPRVHQLSGFDRRAAAIAGSSGTVVR
jgi:hypothetical protein